MSKNQKTNDKTCSFYTSDYHFEMISLPYISKKIEENKDVIILTENNLENTIKKLVTNINLNEDKKEKILNLNWKNDDLNKIKLINKNTENNKNMVIFIKGNENYIKNIKKNIEKWTEKNKNTKVIDCYDLQEISNKLDVVVSNYNKVLSTKGEKIFMKIK